METLTCNEWCLLPLRKINLSFIAQRIGVTVEKTQKGVHLILTKDQRDANYAV